MIKLSVNEKKNLDFQFELSGLSPNQIDMRLRTVIDGVEYGFPAEMRHESIHVTIPPLKTVVKRDFREGETFKASLDVTGDGHFLQPWADSLQIHNPIKMEAKVKDGEYIEEEKKPELKVKVQEEKVEKPKNDLRKMVEERITKYINREKSKSGGKVTKQQKSRVSTIRESKKSKKGMTKEQFMSMTREDIMNYIKRVKTKDPRIQEIIYNQAVQAAKTSKPYKVFPFVMEIIGRGKK